MKWRDNSKRNVFSLLGRSSFREIQKMALIKYLCRQRDNAKDLELDLELKL